MLHLLINFHILSYLNHFIIYSDAPDFHDLTNTVVKWLNAFMVPVSVIIGGISIYKLMAIGWKIAHTADRPDERKIAILALVWWGVGLVLCIAAPLIINLVLPQLMNASGGGYHPPN